MITHGLTPFFLCFGQVHCWQTGAGRVQCLSWHQSPTGYGRGRRVGEGEGGGRRGRGRKGRVGKGKGREGRRKRRSTGEEERKGVEEG